MLAAAHSLIMQRNGKRPGMANATTETIHAARIAAGDTIPTARVTTGKAAATAATEKHRVRPPAGWIAGAITAPNQAGVRDTAPLATSAHAGMKARAVTHMARAHAGRTRSLTASIRGGALNRSPGITGA